MRGFITLFVLGFVAIGAFTCSNFVKAQDASPTPREVVRGQDAARCAVTIDRLLDQVATLGARNAHVEAELKRLANEQAP